MYLSAGLINAQGLKGIPLILKSSLNIQLNKAYFQFPHDKFAQNNSFIWALCLSCSVREYTYTVLRSFFFVFFLLLAL